MEYGLLGGKLGHSFSPQIHKALAGYDYRLLPTPRGEVEALFRRRDFKGLNVTIPYKQTVVIARQRFVNLWGKAVAQFFA